MRIVYFGFDLFADCLKEIFESDKTEVLAVRSFKTDNEFEFNSEVKALALSHGVPFSEEKITEQEAMEYFKNGCELFVSAGYIYKIPVLDIPNFRGINVHPALLPVGRGAWPYPCTILKGLTKSGVTVHKLAKGFDEGDILLQHRFDLSNDETLDTLTEKSQKAAAEMIKQVIEDFDTLWQNAVPQKGGEYWQEPGDDERTITSELTVEQATLIKRAFGSYGVIYNGRVFKGNGEKTVTAVLKNGKIILN